MLSHYDSNQPVWLLPVVSATLRAWRFDASGSHPVSAASVNKEAIQRHLTSISILFTKDSDGHLLFTAANV